MPSVNLNTFTALIYIITRPMVRLLSIACFGDDDDDDDDGGDDDAYGCTMYMRSGCTMYIISQVLPSFSLHEQATPNTATPNTSVAQSLCHVPSV